MLGHGKTSCHPTIRVILFRDLIYHLSVFSLSMSMLTLNFMLLLYDIVFNWCGIHICIFLRVYHHVWIRLRLLSHKNAGAVSSWRIKQILFFGRFNRPHKVSWNDNHVASLSGWSLELILRILGVIIIYLALWILWFIILSSIIHSSSTHVAHASRWRINWIFFGKAYLLFGCWFRFSIFCLRKWFSWRSHILLFNNF